MELKILRQRLQAGQDSKARRGELLKRLPVGYAKDGTGKVLLHPDRRVCEAIQLVFSSFENCGACADVPVVSRSRCGVTRRIHPRNTACLEDSFAKPVADILRDPFYAGAYVGKASDGDFAGQRSAQESGRPPIVGRRSVGSSSPASCGIY